MKDNDVQRFFVPTKPTLVEGFRVFRAYREKVFEAKGETLDPTRERRSHSAPPDRVP